MRFARDWATSKTTWASLAGILAALSGYWGGQLDGAQTAAAVWTALQVAFVRDTIAKAAEPVSETDVPPGSGAHLDR